MPAQAFNTRNGEAEAAEYLSHDHESYCHNHWLHGETRWQAIIAEDITCSGYRTWRSNAGIRLRLPPYWLLGTTKTAVGEVIPTILLSYKPLCLYQQDRQNMPIDAIVTKLLFEYNKQPSQQEKIHNIISQE